MAVLFDIIAFDADDTLWHNERIYTAAKNDLAAILSGFQPPEVVAEHLYRTDIHNIPHFGYGIKAYTLSMIETAVELSGGKISGQEIQAILRLARNILDAEVDLLEYVADVIPQAAARHRLMVITKGDLLEQNQKIIRSGLGDYFEMVEVVSHKKRESYEHILAKYGLTPDRFLMIGNSPRSDILPVLEMGGQAVYIPYESTWLHEHAELPPENTPGFHTLDHIGQLPALLEKLEAAGG